MQISLVFKAFYSSSFSFIKRITLRNRIFLIILFYSCCGRRRSWSADFCPVRGNGKRPSRGIRRGICESMDGFDAWICFRATEPGADQASWGFVSPPLLKRLDPGLRGVLRTLMPSQLVFSV